MRGYRELCSLVGVAKLVCVAACGHMSPALRAACALQLGPAAYADTCATVHGFMRAPERALAGGTAQKEVDLLRRVAEDLMPATADGFMRAVAAQAVHMVGEWPFCEAQVRYDKAQPAWPLYRQPAR